MSDDLLPLLAAAVLAVALAMAHSVVGHAVEAVYLALAGTGLWALVLLESTGGRFP